MGAVGDLRAPGQNHQRRHGADHHGVKKHLHDPHKPLLRRMDTFRRAVGDGRRSHSRLVGECPPAHTDSKSPCNAPHHPARHCRRIPCAPDNRCQRPGDHSPPQPQRRQTQQDIRPAYHRNHRLRRMGQPLRSPRNHHRRNGGKSDPKARGEAVPCPRLLQRRHHCVDLGCIPHSEGRQQSKQRIHPRCPAPPPSQGVLNDVHGSRPSILFPMPYRQQPLGIFDTHAQKSADPHPKYRTRPADGDGTGNACDVSRPHRGRESCAKRPESGIPLPHPPEKFLHRLSQHPHLYKPRPQSQPKARSQNQPQHRHAPQKSIDPLQHMPSPKKEKQPHSRLLS